MRRRVGDEVGIFLVGGGTAGSVMPLLAVAEHLVDAKIYFVGTKTGVERMLVGERFTYLTVPAGKFRRYFSWRNFIDIIFIKLAFFKALYLILKYKPQVIISAGSFIAPPVVWAGWCCGVKIVVHQQDLQVSLTTRLTAPFAMALTKAFNDISLRGAEWIGNPVRDLTPTTNYFKLDQNYPTVFIVGGGTGAQAINDLVSADLCDIANVIHVTGKNKTHPNIQHTRYHAFELLTSEYAEALHKADIVVARAGLGTISELALLGKPAIIIPIPHSHQEYNAEYLKKRQVAIILSQAGLTAQLLTKTIQNLLNNTVLQQQLSQNIKSLVKPNAARLLAEIIFALE
ncbi:MAG: UDP-N-acetylglucosamine--N-acetylmuramyl-(pentapeptide) pyrophosphoryl-undecaprenol N-acetylglucosamine transferase [Patescibacteria group bacterium]